MSTESQAPIVIYQEADQAVEVRLDAEHETVWLMQAQMAELFDVKPQNITMHLKNVYADGELVEEATCKDFLQVRQEGQREVKRKRKHYSLDAVSAARPTSSSTSSIATTACSMPTARWWSMTWASPP